MSKYLFQRDPLNLVEGPRYLLLKAASKHLFTEPLQLTVLFVSSFPSLTLLTLAFPKDASFPKSLFSLTSIFLVICLPLPASSCEVESKLEASPSIESKPIPSVLSLPLPQLSSSNFQLAHRRLLFLRRLLLRLLPLPKLWTEPSSDQQMVNDLPLSPLPRDRLPRFLITRPRIGADIGAVLGAGGGRRLSASSKVKVYLNNQITNTQRLSSRNTFISISMHQG